MVAITVRHPLFMTTTLVTSSPSRSAVDSPASAIGPLRDTVIDVVLDRPGPRHWSRTSGLLGGVVMPRSVISTAIPYTPVSSSSALILCLNSRSHAARRPYACCLPDGIGQPSEGPEYRDHCAIVDAQLLVRLDGDDFTSSSSSASSATSRDTVDRWLQAVGSLWLRRCPW